MGKALQILEMGETEAALVSRKLTQTFPLNLCSPLYPGEEGWKRDLRAEHRVCFH